MILLEDRFKFNENELNHKEFNDGSGLLQYDFGARLYDPQIGRWNVIDPASELSHTWSPYRYGFDNPILYSDILGLWELTANGWYTNNSVDIDRFVAMLQIEESSNGQASIAEVDKFINEEFNGSGGRLSNGSILLTPIEAKRDKNGKWGISDRDKFQVASEIRRYSSFQQNDHNFISKFSIYSYKYFRESSWYANGGQFPGIALGGAAVGYASHFLSNSKTWFNLSKMRSYSKKYFGNQYESAAEVARAKKIATKFSRTLGAIGTVTGIYGGYQTYSDYTSGKYTDFGAIYLTGSNGAGIFGGAIGGSLDLGTTLGQWIVESNWYFNLVHNNNYW